MLSKNKINNLLGRSVSVGPFYYYALNFCNFPYVTLEAKNESLRGFFGSDGSKMTLDLLISRIHPGDLRFVQKREDLISQAVAKVYKYDLINWKS